MNTTDNNQIRVVLTPDRFVEWAGEPREFTAQETKQFTQPGYEIVTMDADAFKAANFRWIYDRSPLELISYVVQQYGWTVVARSRGFILSNRNNAICCVVKLAKNRYRFEYIDGKLMFSTAGTSTRLKWGLHSVMRDYYFAQKTPSKINNKQLPAEKSHDSDALASPPNFDQMVSMIRKLFYDYQEDVLKASPDRIDKAWDRYKTLNHLYLGASAQSDVSGALNIPPFLYSRANGFNWYHYLHIKGGSGSKNGSGGQFKYYVYYATPEQEEKIGLTSPEFACDKLGIACGHGDTIEEAYAHYLTELEKFPLK